jgi:iron complex outermembrane receptor protein
VPAFWTANLSGAYKLPAIGAAKELRLQLNVSNLCDRRYFSTIGSNCFKASDPDGTFATMLTGAPRQVFVTLSGKL